jgi:hypothetical protein
VLTVHGLLPVGPVRPPGFGSFLKRVAAEEVAVASAPRVLAEQLQTALNSRVLIEQAKGVFADRAHVRIDTACTLMRS